jgi:hypothetical protein
MQVLERRDPDAFVAETAELLRRAPARHNLMLGILDLLCRRPEVYRTFRLWSALEGGRAVGAALQTPPHNLIVAEPLTPEAVGALAVRIHASGADLPGVVGARPEAERFVDAWTELAGGQARTSTRQGVYELHEVREHGAASGSARVATQADLDLLVR